MSRIPNHSSSIAAGLALFLGLLLALPDASAAAEPKAEKQKKSKAKDADKKPAKAKKCPCDAAVKKLQKGLVSVRKKGFYTALHARIQGWAGWAGEDSNLDDGDKMQEPGFRLRRARIGLNGHMPLHLGYQLELDLYDNERSGGPLYTAWLGWSPKHFFGARLGVMKVPFMKSETLSSAFLPHLDRALGTFAMAPANAMGLTLQSQPWKDRLTIEVGLYNGLIRQTNFYKGYQGVGVSLGNRFEGLSLAAHISVEPFGPLGRSLADVGKSRKLRLGLGVGGFFNNPDWLSWGDSTVETDALSAHVQLKIAGFHFFGEYAHEWVIPKPQPTTPEAETLRFSRHVANVSLGYVILKNRLGLAFRTEYLDSLLDEGEGPDGTVEKEGAELLFTATVTGYILGDYVKAQLEYTHRMQLDGLEESDDSVVLGVQMMF